MKALFSFTALVCICGSTAFALNRTIGSKSQTSACSDFASPSMRCFKGGFKIVSGDMLYLKDGAKTVKAKLTGLDAFITGLSGGKSQTCLDEKGISYDCGKKSKEHLESLLVKHPSILCAASSTASVKGESYAWVHCKAGSVDLNEAMLKDGWAVSTNLTAASKYSKDEEFAETHKNGAFAGSFSRPMEWLKNQN